MSGDDHGECPIERLPTAEEIVASLDRHPRIRNEVRRLLAKPVVDENALLDMPPEVALVALPALITQGTPFRLVLDDGDHTAVERPPHWPGDFDISDDLREAATEIVYNGRTLKNRTGQMPPRSL